MADKGYTPNLPDILGTITNKKLVNIGLVQAALAIRPRVLRAGKPFETLLLVQNASDIPIDFVARVRLPDRDSKGKKGRFVTKADKLLIGLEAGQVGYIILPVSTLPDTAISSDYAITMDVQMKPASDSKPKRIRTNNGGDTVDTEHLSDETINKIEELSRLSWTADKVSGLRTTGLEIHFGLMSGTVGKISNLQPGWESLWTMADLVDDRLLIEKYREQLATEILPALTLDRIYSRMYQATLANFEAAGFALTKWEAIMVTKMMSLILIFASPTKLTELVAGHYNLQPITDEATNLENVFLPKWTSQFFRLVNREPRAIDYPVKSLVSLCYEGLLHDAITHAFERVELILNESLGTAEERASYRDQVLSDYKDKTLTFSSLYLPLILGGITAADMVVLPGDNMEDAVLDLRDMVDARRREYLNDDTAGLFQMIDRLMEKVLLKYGYNA